MVPVTPTVARKGSRVAIREDREEEAGDKRTSGRERGRDSGGEDAIIW